MKKKSPKSKKNTSPKVAKNQSFEDENQLLELSPIVESVANKSANARFSAAGDEENLLEIPEYFTTAPNVPEMTNPAVETPRGGATNGTAVSEPAFESRFEAVESEIAAEEIEESKFAVQTEDKDIQEIQPETDYVEVLQPEAKIEKVDDIQPVTQLEEVSELEPQLQATQEVAETRPEIQIAESEENQPEIQNIETSDVVQTEKSAETEFQTPVVPETVGETARKSGLAYGAALTLFGSVIFMLVLGYFADWIFGSSPWGIIIGIVLGAAIGFYQFFRITSQIFKNKG